MIEALEGLLDLTGTAPVISDVHESLQVDLPLLREEPKLTLFTYSSMHMRAS